jgi:hypothetical protein
MPHIIEKTLKQAADGSYKSLLKTRILGRPFPATAIISNSHASHTILFRVLVSDDPQGSDGSWGIDKVETSIAPSTVASPYVASGAFCFIDIQIMSAASGQSGEGTAWLLAVGV